MKPSFTEEEKWEDINSLNVEDYNSFEAYAFKLNEDADNFPRFLNRNILFAWLLIAFLFLSTIVFLTFIAYHYLSEYNLIQKVL